MTLRQRALVKTVLMMLGVLAFGVAGAFVSTLMTPAMFSAIMAMIVFGFFCYLVYTWNVTSLEMDERFEKSRKD
jgi:zinc transporter ZupT